MQCVQHNSETWKNKMERGRKKEIEKEKKGERMKE